MCKIGYDCYIPRGPVYPPRNSFKPHIYLTGKWKVCTRVRPDASAKQQPASPQLQFRFGTTLDCQLLLSPSLTAIIHQSLQWVGHKFFGQFGLSFCHSSWNRHLKQLFTISFKENRKSIITRMVIRIRGDFERPKIKGYFRGKIQSKGGNLPLPCQKRDSLD